MKCQHTLELAYYNLDNFAILECPVFRMIDARMNVIRPLFAQWN